VGVGCNFKGSGSWDDSLVLDGVLDCSESVSDGVLDLGDGVLVGALDEEGAGGWVLDALYEGILILSKCVLVELGI
jgi:hypothetical protein